jgi:hypothetical protein
VAFFQVQAIDKVILLKWSLEQSEEVKSFDIERSEDGLRFIKIGSRLAISKSANEDYDFVDATPTKGASLHYRLKLIFKDGFTSYSDLKEIKTAAEHLTIRLKQNPVRSSIDFDVNVPSSRQISIAVVSQAGQQVASQTVRLPAGTNRLSLPAQSLFKGIYQLVVNTGTEQKTLSFIKE